MSEGTVSKNGRLMSLDALRGANMLFIMGGTGLVTALAAFWPDSTVWQWIVAQMKHVEWNGFAHHDMIFPTFLFIAGCAFPFSLAKQRAAGKSNGAILRKVIFRGIVLVLLGILYNNSVNFDFKNLRCASVLGHIGLAWMFAAILTMAFGPKTRFVILTVILLGYWLLMRSFVMAGAPEGTSPYAMGFNLADFIDQKFCPGRLLNPGVHDPEGLFSLLPAIGTALLGVITGDFLRWGGSETGGGKKTLGLLIAGGALIVIGRVWNSDFPINKHLWTSSFVCFVGGLSMVCLAIFYWLIDVMKWRFWAFFFVVIGMNSITIYLAQRIIGFRQAADFFFADPVSRLPELWGSLLGAAGYIAVAWCFLYFLYRHRIFLKV